MSRKGRKPWQEIELHVVRLCKSEEENEKREEFFTHERRKRRGTVEWKQQENESEYARRNKDPTKWKKWEKDGEHLVNGWYCLLSPPLPLSFHLSSLARTNGLSAQISFSLSFYAGSLSPRGEALIAQFARVCRSTYPEMKEWVCTYYYSRLRYSNNLWICCTRRKTLIPLTEKTVTVKIKAPTRSQALEWGL